MQGRALARPTEDGQFGMGNHESLRERDFDPYSAMCCMASGKMNRYATKASATPQITNNTSFERFGG